MAFLFLQRCIFIMIFPVLQCICVWSIAQQCSHLVLIIYQTYFLVIDV